jgi:predicted enzyme related to lactoylglutathione lyase
MTIANDSIHYIEFPMNDKKATMEFYQTAFGWKFTEWGEAYISFEGAGVAGGFDESSTVASQGTGVLVVLYSDNLEAKLKQVEATGATISKPIFSFPGGRRFQFLDPNQNELAVWSE